MKRYLIPLLFSLGAAGIILHGTAFAAKASMEREVSGALLETTIHAQAVDAPKDSQGRILPGSQVKLSVVIKNVGDVPSAPGKMQLRYGYPKAMKRESGSVVFESEIENIPSIPPNEILTVNFQKTHQWPSLFEFIRNDWATREYQAILTVNGNEIVAGMMAVSFSAYYFVGHEDKGPVRVSSAAVVKEPVYKGRTANR